MKKKEQHSNEMDQNNRNEADVDPSLREDEEVVPGLDSATEGELQALKAKAAECDTLRDKYLRLGAEFDNARKRWERERLSVIKFAAYSLIGELIIIVDELEQALKAVKEHSPDEKILAGIEITYKNLWSILKKQGVSAVEAQGKKFDPHIHEIVGQRPVPDDQEHVVLEEVQKGYMLEGKVLRTTKVVIGVKKQPVTSNQKPEDKPEARNSNIETNSNDQNSKHL